MIPSRPVQHPPFVVPRWLGSSHLQTLGAALPLWAPPRSFVPARAEALRIPLPRAASSDWAGALHASAWWHAGPAARTTAILVHGVGGSSDSRYILRAAVSLHRAGLHVVRLDLRGAGGSVRDAPELYHAGLTEDLRLAVAYVADRPLVRDVALVGFSLGGHVVLRLCGELGDAPRGPLRAAVALSPPLDLARVTRAIERPQSLPYHVYVLRQLVARAKAYARAHPDRARYGADTVRTLRSIRAYDDRIIAPMHGFDSAEDYYARMSAGPLISRIAVPTLVIHAQDDPLVVADSVEPWLRDAPAAVETLWTEQGGHLGWLRGFSESAWVNTWAMDRTRSFLARA